MAEEVRQLCLVPYLCGVVHPSAGEEAPRQPLHLQRRVVGDVLINE